VKKATQLGRGVEHAEEGEHSVRHFDEWVLLDTARVNQQPSMHQLAILSTGWAASFHSMSDGVHHSPFIFAVCSCLFFPWT
jgi:hypothetical protein